MESPSAIDLFCGCGGLSLGLEQAGFRVLGAVDVDNLAVETYKANHPEVTVWEADIQDLNHTQVADALGLETGELDLLAGCPPCQGFSLIRTLNGHRQVTDPRNDLLLDFLRFIEGLHPKAVMMENVPGLAKEQIFIDFCARLSEIGYVWEVRILDAADYGVPQRRRRMILLAAPVGSLQFARPADRRRTVSDAIAALPLPGASGDPLHDLPELRTRKVFELIKKIPKDGGSRLDLSENDQLPCHKKCDGFKDVYGRMAWSKPAPTITGGCFNPSKGRFLHPSQDRGITMREAALLQGFPRHYVFPNLHSKSAVALLIGNALPPPFIRRHAEEIIHFLRPSGSDQDARQ